MKYNSIYGVILLCTLSLGTWHTAGAERFECVADTWIRENNTFKGGDSKTIETSGTRTSNGVTDNTRFFALYGFELNIPEGQKVKSATLHLVTERYKGNEVDLYSYANDFIEKDACWSTESDFVTEALSKGSLLKFAPGGQWNKAIFDSGISADNQTLEAWTNDIDISGYVQSLGTSARRVNVLMYQGGGQVCFYSKENTGQNDAFKETASATIFSSDQLMPYLEVTFEEDEDTSVSSLFPSADTWIYKGDNSNRGNGDSMEIYTYYNVKDDGSIDDRELYGLISFYNLPPEIFDTKNYEIESAELRLTTTFLKQSRGINVYDYNHNFNEATVNFASEESFVRETLAGSPALSFDANGQVGKAPQFDDVSEEYKDVKAWQNFIDITDFLNKKVKAVGPDGEKGFSFLLEKDGNHGEATKFATKEATTITNESKGINFPVEDLVPQLKLVYKKKEAVEPVEKTASFGATYYTNIGKSSSDGFSTRPQMVLYNMYGSSNPDKLNSENMGLLRFVMPEEVLQSGNYEIKEASLRLTTTELKGDPTLLVYDYPDFAKGTKFDSQESNVRSALAKDPIASFEAIGMQGVELYDGASDIKVDEATKTVAGWTNRIDITDYLQQKIAGNNAIISLMIRREVNNAWGEWNTISLATNNATDINFTTENGEGVVFRGTDLVPQLTVVYMTGDGEVEIPYYLSFEPISDTEAKVVKCLESPNVTDVRVPSTVELNGVSYSVTEIGEKAFYQNKYVTSVSLPESITVVSNQGFASMTALEKINVPGNLKTIGEWAFYSCHTKQNFVLPATVEEVGRFALSSSFNTVDMSKAEKVTKIEEKTFYNSASANIILPPYLEEIGEEAFWSADIKSIELPSTLRKLGKKAFYSSDLTAVVLPEGIEEIPEYCYGSAKGIETVELPSTLKLIGDGVWSNCPKIHTVVSKALTPPEGAYFNNNGNDKFNSVDFVTLYIPHEAYGDYMSAPGWSTQFQYIYCLEDDEENDHIEIFDNEGFEIAHESRYEAGETLDLVINLHRSYNGYTNESLGKPAAHHFTINIEEIGESQPSESENAGHLPMVKRRIGMDTSDIILNPGINNITLGEGLDLNKNYRVTTTITTDSGQDVATHSFILNLNDITGVKSVYLGNESEAEYYDLHGVRVINPGHGIYIRILNGKADKVVL